LGLTGFFVTLYIVSALLFRRSALREAAYAGKERYDDD
jgi:hypothetical protein